MNPLPKPKTRTFPINLYLSKYFFLPHPSLISRDSYGLKFIFIVPLPLSLSYIYN